MFRPPAPAESLGLWRGPLLFCASPKDGQRSDRAAAAAEKEWAFNSILGSANLTLAIDDTFNDVEASYCLSSVDMRIKIFICSI